MAIRKISVDSAYGVSQYTCGVIDLIGSYPTDCKIGSTMTIYDADGKTSGFCVFDGLKWKITQPDFTSDELASRETILETEGSFAINAGNQPIKKVNIVIPFDVAQVETATVVGTITTEGNAVVSVTSDLFATQVISVPVLVGDTDEVVASKIGVALNLNKQIVTNFVVSIDGADVILTQVIPQIHGLDITLNIAIAKGTCEGLTDDATSVATVASPSISPKVISVVRSPRECEITIFLHCYGIPTSLTFAGIDFVGGGSPTVDVGLNVIKLYTNDGGFSIRGQFLEGSTLKGLNLDDPNITGGDIIPDSLVIPTGTVVKPVSAKAFIGFLGVVADGETVTIGDEVYEFDTDSTITEGNIQVDVSGGVTAPLAVTALALAITTNATSAVTGVDSDGDTVLVTAKVAGIIGNSIELSDTGANITIIPATLEDGVDGTVGVKGTILFDENFIYVSVDTSTTAVSNWKSTALSALA